MREKTIDAACESAMPSLRFGVGETARILRMSRVQLYNRVHDGVLKPPQDASRTHFTRTEFERSVSAYS